MNYIRENEYAINIFSLEELTNYINDNINLDNDNIIGSFDEEYINYYITGIVLSDNIYSEDFLNVLNESFNYEQPVVKKEYTLDIIESVFRSKTICSCVICISDFKKGDNVSRINCNCKPTLFHTVCIKEWGINYKPECPLCRKNIEKKNIKF